MTYTFQHPGVREWLYERYHQCFERAFQGLGGSSRDENECTLQCCGCRNGIPGLKYPRAQFDATLVRDTPRAYVRGCSLSQPDATFGDSVGGNCGGCLIWLGAVRSASLRGNRGGCSSRCHTICCGGPVGGDSLDNHCSVGGNCLVDRGSRICRGYLEHFDNLLKGNLPSLLQIRGRLQCGRICCLGFK